MHEAFWIATLATLLFPEFSQCSSWTTICFNSKYTFSCTDEADNHLVIQEAWLGEVPYAIYANRSYQSLIQSCTGSILNDSCSQDVSLLISKICYGYKICTVNHHSESSLYTKPPSKCLQNSRTPPLHVRYTCAHNSLFTSIYTSNNENLPELKGGYLITSDYWDKVDGLLEYAREITFHDINHGIGKNWFLQVRLLDMDLYPSVDIISISLAHNSKNSVKVLCADCVGNMSDTLGGDVRDLSTLRPLISRLVVPMSAADGNKFNMKVNFNVSLRYHRRFLAEYIVLTCDVINWYNESASPTMLSQYMFLPDGDSGRVVAELSCLRPDTYLFHLSSTHTEAFNVSYLLVECLHNDAVWNRTIVPNMCLTETEFADALRSTSTSAPTTSAGTTNHLTSSLNQSMNIIVTDKVTVAENVSSHVTLPPTNLNPGSARHAQGPRQNLTWLVGALFGLVVAIILVVCFVMFYKRRNRKSIGSSLSSVHRPFFNMKGSRMGVKEGFSFGSWWKIWQQHRGAYSPLKSKHRPFARTFHYATAGQSAVSQTCNQVERNHHPSMEADSMLISMNSTSDTLLSVVPPSTMWDSSAPTSSYMDSTTEPTLLPAANDTQQAIFLQDSNSPSTSSCSDSAGNVPQALPQSVIRSPKPRSSSFMQASYVPNRVPLPPSVNDNSVFEDADDDCVLPVRVRKNNALRISRLVSRFSSSLRSSNALSSPSQKASGSPSISQQYLHARHDPHSGLHLTNAQNTKKQSATLPVSPQMNASPQDPRKLQSRTAAGMSKFPRQHRRDGSVSSMVMSPSVETYLEPNSSIRPSTAGTSLDFLDESNGRPGAKRADEAYWEYDQRKRRRAPAGNHNTKKKMNTPAVRDSFIGMQNNNYYGDDSEAYEVDSKSGKAHGKNGGTRPDSVYEVMDEDPYEDTNSSMNDYNCSTDRPSSSGLFDEASSQPSTLLTQLSPMSERPCSSNVPDSTPTATRRNMALPPRPPQAETDSNSSNILC